MNQEIIAMYRPVREEHRSSKCFVYALAAFVFCFVVLLITASVLRVKNPQVKLRSATLNQISYSASSSPTFNATVVTHLVIKNPNYGGLFSYENCNMRVLYEGVKVGDREIHGGRVNVRETKRMNVTVNVRSDNVTVDLGDLSSEINSGTLNLTCYAKFHGTVQLLKIIHKRKIIEVACIVNINLTSHAIQGIHC